MRSSELEEISKAQAKYCDEHDLPLFAPWKGYCYHCGRNIYEGEYAVTLEVASKGLITYCPHCNYSFVD